MSLKLFRSTGYHSILAPGESRVAMHPGWAITATSLWVGIVCNVWFWQAIGGSARELMRPLLVGLAVAAFTGFVLSLFGWRRTLKATATLLLLMGALFAGGIWTQGLTLPAVLEAKRFSMMLPTWASLFRWQVPTLLGLLGALPMLWIWNAQLRRLAGPAQLQANLAGMTLSALVGFSAYWLLTRLPA
jgi:lipid A ethanolaminephosphotransferase